MKKYEAPQLSVIEMETAPLLAGSGSTDGGKDVSGEGEGGQWD